MLPVETMPSFLDHIEATIYVETQPRLGSFCPLVPVGFYTHEVSETQGHLLQLQEFREKKNYMQLGWWCHKSFFCFLHICYMSHPSDIK
jgi:hypothetical protein